MINKQSKNQKNFYQTKKRIIQKSNRSVEETQKLLSIKFDLDYTIPVNKPNFIPEDDSENYSSINISFSTSAKLDEEFRIYFSLSGEKGSTKELLFDSQIEQQPLIVVDKRLTRKIGFYLSLHLKKFEFESVCEKIFFKFFSSRVEFKSCPIVGFLSVIHSTFIPTHFPFGKEILFSDLQNLLVCIESIRSQYEKLAVIVASILDSTKKPLPLALPSHSYEHSTTNEYSSITKIDHLTQPIDFVFRSPDFNAVKFNFQLDFISIQDHNIVHSSTIEISPFCREKVKLQNKQSEFGTIFVCFQHVLRKYTG
jgi:hypothetical protein